MSSVAPTCAAVLARTLREAGIKRMFGLPGEEILEFIHAAKREGIEFRLAALRLWRREESHYTHYPDGGQPITSHLVLCPNSGSLPNRRFQRPPFGSSRSSGRRLASPRQRGPGVFGV